MINRTLTAKQKLDLRKWTDIIQQREQSGLGINEWCRLNKINKGNYYYWLNKLRSIAVDLTDDSVDTTGLAVPTTTSFAEICLPEKVSDNLSGEQITVIKGDAHVMIPASVNTKTILAVIREVMTCS